MIDTPNGRDSPDHDIAPHIPPKPRRMKGPVAWLLGPQFLAAARRIARAALFRDRTDPRSWMSTRPLSFADLGDGADELWFDFIADSGDSQRATYAVAALCQADLFLTDGDGGAVDFSGPLERRLPRGRFLLIGGDTAYHVADHPSVLTRFVAPFVWATRDLARAGLLPASPEPRPLLGIPGDHDYYGLLDGFQDLFRRAPEADPTANRQSQLRLPGHCTVQDASYFALTLPFGWSLWAMDCLDGIDDRQREFFAGLAAPQPPRKLVTLTHFPPAAMGRIESADGPVAATFAAVGLRRPFLPPHEPLPPGYARLDLAGNVHHYERYDPTRRSSYASVVAGTGGAFLHPSDIDYGELPREVVFPSAARSARLMARRLFSPGLVLSGGYVAFWAGVVSAMMVLCAGIDPGTRAFVSWVLGHKAVNLMPFLEGAGLFGAILAAGAFVVLSWQAGGRVYRRTFIRGRGGQHRGVGINAWSYRYAFLLALLALGTPLAAVALLGDAPASALLAGSLFTTLLLGLVVGLAAAGVVVGAAPFRTAWPKIGFGALGAVHGLAQAVTGIVLARAGLAWAATYVAFVAVYGWLLGPRLMLARRGPCRPHGWLAGATPVAGGWAVALGLLILPFMYGQGDLPTAGLPLAGRVAIAAFAGGMLAPLWLGWYLAVSSAAGGHYNEVAGAARVEHGKALVRVRVRADALTVYVIGLDEVADEIGSLRPRLVDRFDVSPEP